MSKQDYAEFADEKYVETVHTVAQSLREAVDDFERAALGTAHGSAVADRGPRAIAVVKAVHSLNWGIANASVERIFRDAIEADFAERDMSS